MQDGNGHIFSVSALTRTLKGTLEAAFPFVWVRGQVVNLSRPSSGHVYFALRDEEASLAAVWFRRAQKPEQRFDPLTGEVFEGGPRASLAQSLENGQEIVCAGRLSVYAPRGSYQLIVELAQDIAQGRLQAEFELLRGRLAAEGFFSAARKRPLPAHPLRVAVITAPSGAAVHDFLRISSSRGLAAEIRVHPSLVQGEAAPADICRALAAVNAQGWAEVIVLIRGGGSPEDLAAFNTEPVARAVFASRIPVLAGIGHEVDVTLADMTADVRAATPSHAAQLLWSERADLQSEVRFLSQALGRAAQRALARTDADMSVLRRALGWHAPGRRVEGWEERLGNSVRRLLLAGRADMEKSGARLDKLREGLDSAPLCIPSGQAALEQARLRLEHGGSQALLQAERRLECAGLRLEAVDPHAPLERGYALVRARNGRFVRSVEETLPGDLLDVLVRDGAIPVRVEKEGA